MLYLLALVAIGGQLGASAGVTFEVPEHKLIEIKSTIEIPADHAVLLTNWTVADGLDYRQTGDTLITTGPPGEYAIRQQVVTAKTEGDVIKLPIQQHFAVYQLTITGKTPRPPPKDPDDPVTDKVDKITYVYERQEGTVPREVEAKFRELNASGTIEATTIDKDIKDGTGQIPEQYAVALSAAAGKEPCFVVQSGETVVRVVKTLEEAISD